MAVLSGVGDSDRPFAVPRNRCCRSLTLLLLSSLWPNAHALGADSEANQGALQSSSSRCLCFVECEYMQDLMLTAHKLYMCLFVVAQIASCVCARVPNRSWHTGHAWLCC